MSRPDFIEWKPSARELATLRSVSSGTDDFDAWVAHETLRIEIKRAELALEFDLLSKAPRW